MDQDETSELPRRRICYEVEDVICRESPLVAIDT